MDWGFRKTKPKEVSIETEFVGEREEREDSRVRIYPPSYILLL